MPFWKPKSKLAGRVFAIVTVNGGEIYAAGGNLTIQRIGPESREIADMLRETVSQTIDRRLEEMIGGRLHLPPVISTGFLYVMDATGRHHTVTMDMAHSLEQFTAALRVLFFPERPQNRVLQKHMDIGAFVLTIDDGREHLQLTGQEVWTSTIGGGMTIVMSVGMAQEVHERTPTKYTCPFCRCQNRLKGNNGNASMGCHSCKRRFQVRLADRGIDEMETASIANNEWDLIQNIYLRQGMGGAYRKFMRCSVNTDRVATPLGSQHVEPPVPNQPDPMSRTFNSDLVSTNLNSGETMRHSKLWLRNVE